MSKNLTDKKRVLDICNLRRKLAQANYHRAHKNIAELEVSGQRLGMMAEQILRVDECTHAPTLSTKLEFGHRLITLQILQIKKIAKERRVAAALQSSVLQSARIKSRADLDFRAAKKTEEENRFRDLPTQVQSICSPESRSKKDKAL